jgi:hypothetical protein
VETLEAYKDLDFTFEKVRLKQGMRDLNAIISGKTVEVDKNNDQVKIRVNCRDN